MDLSYFQQINNVYKSNSKQETDLFLLNRHVNDRFDDTIDYHVVKRNDKDFELIIKRVADTETKKTIKSRPGCYFNLGDIIEWHGSRWIISEVDPDDKTYLSGAMRLCNLRLIWKNKKGNIVDRYCFAENLTKYSSGVTGFDEIKNADYQYGITIGYDDETRVLKRDKRFIIDDIDIIPPEAYKLTGREIFINNCSYFNRGGIINFTISHHEYNENTDKVITLSNGEQVWCADYISIDDRPVQEVSTEITWTGRNIIIAGGNYKTFSVKFTDKYGDDIELKPIWIVTSLPNFEQYIHTKVVDSNFLVKADYTDEILGESIQIDVSDESGQYHSSIQIEIGGGI